jgi:hypothetical protein
MGPRPGLDISRKETNILPLPGFEHQISQPTASHYTDYTIPAPLGPERFTKCEIRIGIYFLWQLLRGTEGNHKNFTARPQCDTESNSVKPVNE